MSTDFSSIDRLVEFGMGLSLAQQMVGTMNHVMDNAKISGVNGGTTGQSAVSAASTCQCVPEQWYAVIDNRQVGPLSNSEVKDLVKKGVVKDDTFMWRPGLTAWQFARNIPEINKIRLMASDSKL